jgi:hypothetical protein
VEASDVMRVFAVFVSLLPLTRSYKEGTYANLLPGTDLVRMTLKQQGAQVLEGWMHTQPVDDRG